MLGMFHSSALAVWFLFYFSLFCPWWGCAGFDVQCHNSPGRQQMPLQHHWWGLKVTQGVLLHFPIWRGNWLMERVFLRCILTWECPTLKLGAGGFLRAAEFMAGQQGNKLGGQEGGEVPWSAIIPNSLFPALGYRVSRNAFPFLCLLWNFFFFFSAFCQWISNYSTNNWKTPMRKVLQLYGLSYIWGAI